MEAVHAQVLAAALSLTGPDTGWRFRIRDVVRTLPHLNAGTVRTHVASRCSVNAPAHHQSRHPYFRSVSRGEYRIESRYRTGAPTRRGAKPWPDRWLDTVGTGVDLTQIVESLRLTPTERLEQMRHAAESLEAMRRP